MLRESAIGRGIFAALFLCALAIRVMVPAGFMPTTTAHGVVVSLCAGQSSDHQALDLGKKVPGQHKGNADSPCSFAAGLGGGLLDTSSVPLSVPLPSVAALPLGRAIADLVVHRLAAPPPPALGPPALG